jgi:hypothetical protein
MALNGIDATKYTDILYSGVLYSSGLYNSSMIVHGSEAIKNTIRMYLMSQKGDYRRNVTKGGPMISVIGKPLTDEYGAKIEAQIKAAVESYKNIVITYIKADKDLENKRWIVHVSFTDTYNKSNDSLSLGIAGAN